MGEFTFVYLLHEEGLFRVNVSDLGRARKNELKLECVYYAPPSSSSGRDPFKAMGLFSNRHTLYMIGGDSAKTGRYPDGSSFYSFNPTRFNEFPVQDPECIDEPDFYGDFGAVKCPHVVRANRMFYFFPKGVAGFYFRSFDPAENRFYTLPQPPFVLDNRARVSEISGDFVLGGYIYLFVKESSDVEGSCFHRAFSFNTRSLKWREEESMVLQFQEKDIPLPYNHRGGIGLSYEFSDNTHVLVALSGRVPTAYCVCLHPRGSFSPKSYRKLYELYIDGDGPLRNGQLFDLGSGRFCWIYYSTTEAFVVCVFKIDFAREHEIQISPINEERLIFSSQIISFKIFYDRDIPFSWDYEFIDVCLGSGPALHSYVLSVPSKDLCPVWSEELASPSNEDQDRDGEIEKRNTISSCKRDGGGNDARGPEHRSVEEECEQIEGSVGEKQVRSLSRPGSRLSEKKGKDICEASTNQDERLCCRGGNDARGPEDMGIEEECGQIDGSVGEKQVRSLSHLGSRQSEKKGKAICAASTRQDESQEDDPVALARSLASQLEMTGLVKTGDNALSRWFISTQLKAIMYGLAMIDRGDAASEHRIIQEAENTAAEAKVKVLELQLEASNKANSAAQARLEALEQEKIKLSETVEAQRKQLKAKDEELASTQDKAIQEWRQSKEFRQAAQSYARENMDAVLSRILSDKVVQNHIFKALFKTAYEEDEGQAPGPSALEEGFGRQEHEVMSAPNCADQDRDGQMEKRNKINSDKEEMGGNNAKKRCCRSRD